MEVRVIDYDLMDLDSISSRGHHFMFTIKCNGRERSYTSIQGASLSSPPRSFTEERGTSEEEMCLDVLFTGPFFCVKKKGTEAS